MIKFHDKGVLVSYIQVFLKEYFGMTIVEFDEGEYEVSQNNQVRVTDEYDQDTYVPLSLYIALQYPKENYPVRYDFFEGDYIKTEFNYDKLSYTVNKLIKSGEVSESVTVSGREDYEKRTDKDCLTYDEAIRYYDNLAKLNYFLVELNKREDKDFTKSDSVRCLINFIIHNVNEVPPESGVFDLNDRIVSYILGEVVTHESESDEISRVQKLLYPNGIEISRVGVFDKEMTSLVESYQSGFINKYLNEEEIAELPPRYKDFKVTGYVDPWTEVIIKGEVDIDDEDLPF